MSTRTLWLLRHAKAVADPPTGGADFDRVLAPRGRRDASALAQQWRSDGTGLGLNDVELPTLALVSPAARTAATAELALAELGDPPERRLVGELYAAEPEDVLDQLRSLKKSVSSVMVVGHNPTAHALSQGLITKADTEGRALATKRGFPTCALGVYRFDVARWSEVGAQTAHLLALLVPPYATEGGG
jgi:phosphohistidine phosphatase